MKVRKSPAKGPAGDPERGSRLDTPNGKNSRLERRGGSPAPSLPARVALGSGPLPRKGSPFRRSGAIRSEWRRKPSGGRVRRYGRSARTGGRSALATGKRKQSWVERSRPESSNVDRLVGSWTSCSGSNRGGRRDGSARRRKPAVAAMPRPVAAKAAIGGQPAAGTRESGGPAESRRRGAIPGGMAPHPKGHGINHSSFRRPQRVSAPATGLRSRKPAPVPVSAGAAAHTKDP